jgi:hypothetical protein
MEVMLSTLTSFLRPDERFIMHRFKSSRLALATGMVAILVVFNYELLVRDTIRWDLAVIAGVMAMVKVVAMIYYMRTR